jgi:hypothetical protein
MYHARRLSQSALKAEREERTFDAGSFWGQVAVKADSAYSRDPAGSNAFEALWLRGRALAHMGDCAAAMPALDRAYIGGVGEDWHDDLRLELARCRSTAGDAPAVLEELQPLLTSEDDRLREQARALAGRSLLRAGRWEAAREFLADDESTDGRWLHAVALARLGRGVEALELVAPRTQAGDSLANWDELFRAFASTPGSPGAVELRTELARHKWVTETTLRRWDLSMAETSLLHDPGEGMRMLARLTEGINSPATTRARMLVAEHDMRQVRDDTTLTAALARIERIGRDDPTALFVTQRLVGWGSAIRHDIDTLPAGAPEGDMTMFFHATVARDTLQAPALAAWLLRRLERDWPGSPYVPKALLARMPLEPDSLAALRARLETHTESPYLAYLAGREDARFSELEYTLDFFLAERFAASSTVPVDQ